MSLTNLSNDDSVLVTGGTGSFGRAMVDYLLASGFERICIFSRDEVKQESMRLHYSNDALRFYIGDVRDPNSIDNAMRGVSLVFHAAALKQVPSCEFFPLEAVRTNILGSANVLEAAVRRGVRSVVCLSTDKAVMPINAMGMSKALMEKTAQSLARTLDVGETTISSVRYGNIMCSRGSVIPLFVQQIRADRPLTVTDSNMTRFMLNLKDSIDLVEFAFDNAKQGDLFVKKAPACTVKTLVEVLLDIFDVDRELKVIGMRHGEKLFETLASAEELRSAEDLKNYYRIPLDNRDLNYEKYFTEGYESEYNREDYHSHNTTRLNHDELKTILLSLPEIQRELAFGPVQSIIKT